MPIDYHLIKLAEQLGFTVDVKVEIVLSAGGEKAEKYFNTWQEVEKYLRQFLDSEDININ